MALSSKMQERAENFGITFRLDICGLYKVCQGVQAITVALAYIVTLCTLLYTLSANDPGITCQYDLNCEAWIIIICSHLCSFLVYSIENI